MNRAADERPLLHREAPEVTPATDYDSKTVMLRAERGDKLAFPEVICRLFQGADIPSEASIVRRTTPYFGPKLLLYSSEGNYLLTAPGPDTQLLLWLPETNEYDERIGWKKLAEVRAKFVDDQPQYDLCPECGRPLQTLEHERKSEFGNCTGPEI
jgi:hypothetical protein